MLAIEILHSPASNPERIITKLAQHRAVLETTKRLLEPLLRDGPEAQAYTAVSNLMEPFKYVKFGISDRYNTPSVSVAWLKMIEILNHFNVFQYLLRSGDEIKHVIAESPIDHLRSPSIRREISGDGYQAEDGDGEGGDGDGDGHKRDKYEQYKDIDYITVFDNVGLPGSFLLAIMHYLLSNTRDSVLSSKFYWYANAQSQNPSAKEDAFGLYHNYQDSNHWIGFTDTSSLEGIKPITDFFHSLDESQSIPVHLFVSDKSVPLRNQFDKQEEIHAQANYSQVCCAMGVLVDGGCMITKQFMITTPATIHLIDRLTECFEHLHLCKPEASKHDNSEIYLVGLNFHAAKGAALYAALLNELKNFRLANYTASTLANATHLKSIYQASIQLMDHQINTINSNIAVYEEYKSDANNVKRQIMEKNKGIVTSWFARIHLKPLDSRDWLDVENTTEYQIKKAPKEDGYFPPERTSHRGQYGQQQHGQQHGQYGYAQGRGQEQQGHQSQYNQQGQQSQQGQYGQYGQHRQQSQQGQQGQHRHGDARSSKWRPDDGEQRGGWQTQKKGKVFAKSDF